MRLINTSTGAFEEFIGRNIPEYAILSHTWEDEEVSYQDYLGGACPLKKGYEKIRKTCELARESGVVYAWVDTCCIDKSSSAELTEAINSMYIWYQRSQRCYVYFSDLLADADLATQLSACRWQVRMSQCQNQAYLWRRFTRGWTLQELIAPFETHFFDSQWNQVGTKASLRSQISLITGVNLGILQHDEALSSVCVARKMSWAAKRMTTRIEDMAYCLLGLFGVNMPLLYGEESKAFRRLQEEIIRSSPDLSIFAWIAEPSRTGSSPLESDIQPHCGLLAQSPVPFAHARKLQTASFGDYSIEFSVRNNGIKTNSVFHTDSMDGYISILPLYCHSSTGPDLAIRLRKVGSNTFVRDGPYNLYCYNDTLLKRATQGYCYVLVEQPSTRAPLAWSLSEPTKKSWTPLFISSSHRNVLSIRCATFDETVIQVQLVATLGCFDDEDGVFFVPEGDRTDCAGEMLTVHVYDESFQFMILAFGWSTDIDTTQYTVIDAQRWTTEISKLQPLLTQGINTRTQLLEKMACWGVPKVSRTVLPILKPKRSWAQSVCIQLEPDFERRTIWIHCGVLGGGQTIAMVEDRGNWEWPSS